MDGFRGGLAVYVMVGHAVPMAVLPGWAEAPFRHGEAAVDLFFALSGLVIIFSLSHHAGRFWPFMLARGRRLLPVYVVALALSLCVLALGSPVLPWTAGVPLADDILGGGMPPALGWHVAAHLVLVQGLLPQGLLPFAYVTLLGPAWSLSAEWQFYLLIALVLARLPGFDRLSRFTIWLLATGIVYHLVEPLLPDYWRFSRAFLPDAAPWFTLGLASAVWWRGGGWGLLLVCSLATGVLGLTSSEPGRAFIPLAWALMLGVQARDGFPVLGALLESRTAQYLGAISYPLYLVNEPVQRALMLLASRLAHGNGTLFTWLWLPPALLAPLGVAALLHHGVEKPVMALRMPRYGGASDYASEALARPRKMAS
jgi:peptidoglycan/LPS O-acetylase OafA/YrhL